MNMFAKMFPAEEAAWLEHVKESLRKSRFRTPRGAAAIPQIDVPIPVVEKRSTEISTSWGKFTMAVPTMTYVIRSGDFVKIGATADIENRVRQLMIGNPHEVTTIALLAGGRKLEGILHRRFKAHRHRHEWFRIEGALAEWIDAGCPMEADNAT